MIRAYEYEGEWLTINTMKELLNVRERLRKHNSKSSSAHSKPIEGTASKEAGKEKASDKKRER